MIVTVTLNAAFDRTITVPNFQRGQRHRASAGLPLAGGKGINVARALKTLGVPVVATGLAGGAGRTADRRASSPARRSSTTSSASRASRARRPPSSTRPATSYTEINEWGPAVRPEELEILREKLRYLSQGAELVVFAGSLPRDVEDDFYAERDPRARPPPRALGARLRGRAAAARRRGRAVPRLAEPAARPRRSSGRSSTTTRTSCSRSTASPTCGARNVIITTEGGCFALLREEARERPPLPRRSRRGRAGLARRRRRRAARRLPRRRSPGARPRTRCARRSPRAPPRRSSSAPGGFDPREAVRLQARCRA